MNRAVGIKQAVYGFLFSLSMFILFIQDIPLQERFGTIAKTPVVFIAPIIFLVLLVRQGKFKLFKLPKYYGLYWCISTLTAILMLCVTVLFVTSGELYVYKEFFLSKLIRASTYNLVYFFTVYNLCITMRALSFDFIYKVTACIFLFLIFYGFVQLLFIEHPIPFFHYTVLSEYESRIILTNSEPSMTFPMFAVIAALFIGMRILLRKNNLITLLYAAISVFMLIEIQSKSGMIFIIIAALFVLRKNFNLKMLAFIAAIVIPVAYILIEYVIPAIAIDIELFTSFSTRSTTFIASFVSLIKYPLGEGYGTYLQYYPSLLLPVNDWISSIINIPLSTVELDDMISTGVNLPGKSGIPNEIMLNGVSAIIFFYWLFRFGSTSSKAVSNRTIRLLFSALFVFLFLEFFLGAIFETAYFFVLPFIFVDIIAGRERKFNAEKESSSYQR